MFFALITDGNNQVRAKSATVATDQPDRCGSLGKDTESQPVCGVPQGSDLGSVPFPPVPPDYTT